MKYFSTFTGIGGFELWATRKEQCRNKSNNRFIIFGGEKKTRIEWVEILKILIQLDINK